MSSLVRRADWRFLLPTPLGGRFQHLLLLGGSAQLGGWLVDIGFADSWSCQPSVDPKADVVAVLDGADVDIRYVINQLKPGGVLYYESNRLRHTNVAASPIRIHSVLEAAGCKVQGTYVVRPSFTSAALYLPVDAPHALAWYVGSLYPASTLKQRLLEWGLRASTGLRTDRFATVAPFVALVATRGASAIRLPTVLQCPEIAALMGEGPGNPIVPIMLSYGDNRILLLPLAREEREPRLIVKVPRLATFNDRNHNEQATLREVRAMVDSSLRRSIPKPLGRATLGDISVNAESFVPGESLLRSSGMWGRSIRHKIEDLHRAGDWLCAFHEQTTTHIITWSESAYQEHVATLLHEYQQSFGMTDQEELLFSNLQRHSQLLAGCQIPIVWQHRDFNIWNVVRDGDEIGVIDWEGGQRGLPLLDLLHFAAHWVAAVQRAVTIEARLLSFERLFLRQEPHPDRATRAVNQVIHQYCNQLGIDRKFLPVLLVHTWLELVLRRKQQQDDMRETRATPRENNQYLSYIAVLAAHANIFLDDDANR